MVKFIYSKNFQNVLGTTILLINLFLIIKVLILFGFVGELVNIQLFVNLIVGLFILPMVRNYVELKLSYKFQKWLILVLIIAGVLLLIDFLLVGLGVIYN